jgi:hypothetical protein
MFNKVMQTTAYILIVLGIIAMAGSGGDCDGKCGPGNCITEMLQIAAVGLAMLATGAVILIKGDA